MDEKIRREEMSDIDAMNAMEEIDRISTGEGADELNGVWSSAGPRGISDGVMNSMEHPGNRASLRNCPATSIPPKLWRSSPAFFPPFLSLSFAG